MSDDHERIWLQNAQDAGPEGRLWCQDKVWPENEDESEPTEYVLADTIASLRKEVETLRAALTVAREWLPCVEGHLQSFNPEYAKMREQVDAALKDSDNG